MDVKPKIKVFSELADSAISCQLSAVSRQFSAISSEYVVSVYPGVALG